MLTSHQIRAARALLRWSAQKLADETRLGLSTVQRMEGAEDVPSASGRNLEAVQRCLETAGIEFIEEYGRGVGVKFRSGTRAPDQ
jgi:transcriptional regulator with XRE-family HTH domain